MIKENIYEKLNEEQHQASISEFGNILVLAGAGTGKTSTIAARVVHLLTEKKIKPKDIVLLTFTSKASMEMKERLKKYIDDDIVGSISVSTFHALCLGIVRKYFPEKKLISERDARNLLDTTYSRVIKFIPDGLYSSNAIYSFIDNYINSDSNIIFSIWLNEEIVICEENQEYLLGQYQLIYDSFLEDKSKYNALTFADLLLCAREYLLTNKNTIQEMIIDEFQDTNPLQDSTIKAINSKSLFCVGDYDQSIYAFNGADLEIIEQFKNRDNFKLHNLSKNYRCQKPILDIAEKVIANNERIYPKTLEVMIDVSEPMKPYCVVAESTFEQYTKVAELCLETIARKKVDETIAILYRSNGSGNGIEMVFKEYGIAVERNVKNTFMENIDIQIIFNVVKLILFKNLEYLEFSNVFTGVVNHHSKEAIESYYNMLTHNGTTSLLDGLRKDKARQIGSNGVFYSDSRESVLSLLELLEFNKHTNTSSLINSLIKSKFFINTLNRFASSFTKGDDEKADKLFNASVARAESMLKIAKRYSKLQKFYQDLTRPNLNDDNDEEANPDKATLLTVHSSKGLEYTYLFIIDMDDDTFPSKKLMNKRSDDEERRLFYVACTRAKKELTFFYAKRSSNGKQKKPSRFLVEAGLVAEAVNQNAASKIKTKKRA
ncbi:ATP-dependent helicase [Sulfurimonas sp.]|uniref:ATP-dependent helicase n=1 Tax=Sulfurimonas sp. TaxID=2022749 RepID=UPI0025F95185|nr:ATP-dependent helicase [Sulfurimonas sp.]